MVYCSKCGNQNTDEAKYCSKCGTNLKVLQEDRTEAEWGEEFGEKMEKWGKNFGKNMEKWGENFGKNMEDECFGFPHGSAIVGIIFGLIIVVVGLGILLEWIWSYILAFIIIVLGALILLGAIFRLKRKKT